MNIMLFDPFETEASHADLKKILAGTGLYPEALKLIEGSRAFGVLNWDDLHETLFTDAFDAVLLCIPDDPENRAYCLKDMQRYSARKNRKTMIALSNDPERTHDYTLLAAGAGYIHHTRDDPRILAEYLARVASAPARIIPKYKVGPLSIDWENCHVAIDERPIRVSPLEYKTLSVLGQNIGRYVSEPALRERLYAGGDEALSNTPMVMISRLRAKFSTEAAPENGYRLIRLLAGRGYRLAQDEAEFLAPLASGQCPRAYRRKTEGLHSDACQPAIPA